MRIKSALGRWLRHHAGTDMLGGRVAALETAMQHASQIQAACDAGRRTEIQELQRQDAMLDAAGADLHKSIKELYSTMARSLSLIEAAAAERKKKSWAKAITAYGQALTLFDGPPSWHAGLFGTIESLKRATSESDFADILRQSLQSDVGNIVELLPLPNRLIWIDPSSVKKLYVGFSYSQSASVVEGDWDLRAVHITGHRTVNYCWRHWDEGIPWEKTEAYVVMAEAIANKGRAVDGCSTMEEIRDRFKRLDEVYNVVKKKRYMYTQKQIRPSNSWETGGIFVNIGRNRELIFGGGGFHRFSMAQILRLPIVPAMLGVIHPGTGV